MTTLSRHPPCRTPPFIQGCCHHRVWLIRLCLPRATVGSIFAAVDGVGTSSGQGIPMVSFSNPLNWLEDNIGGGTIGLVGIPVIPMLVMVARKIIHAHRNQLPIPSLSATTGKSRIG